MLWTNEHSHSWNADCTWLFMCFTGVGQQGKIRPSLTSEVEANKLFPVSEVFRFNSQVGFLTLIGSCQFCISN